MATARRRAALGRRPRRRRTPSPRIERHLADELIERGIRVDCRDPGPTDTGWATEEPTQPAGALPRGSGGALDEVAAVVG